MKTTIYALYKNNIPFYVGKTKNPKHRLRDHQSTYGKETIMKVLDEIPSVKKEDWKPYEMAWIQIYKEWGYELTNQNKGGGGQEGWKTKEERQQYVNCYNKKYNLENKKKVKEYYKSVNYSPQRKWYEKNKEQQKEYTAQRRQTLEYIEYHKQYYLNNKEKWKCII